MATPAKQTVAVVEDDEAMRKAIRRVLETEGFVTEVFDRAETFLASGAALRAHCLVLDIRLPGMSGIDLHEQLLSRENALPTVFITAHDDARARRVAARGTNCCLTKPFLGEALIEAINRAIAR